MAPTAPIPLVASLQAGVVQCSIREVCTCVTLLLSHSKPANLFKHIGTNPSLKLQFVATHFDLRAGIIKIVMMLCRICMLYCIVKTLANSITIAKVYVPIIFSNHMSRLAMLKGWVLKYHDRYFQAFPSIVARSIVPQESMKIQSLLSTLQEPANNAYTCMVATTQMPTLLRENASN